MVAKWDTRARTKHTRWVDGWSGEGRTAGGGDGGMVKRWSKH